MPHLPGRQKGKHLQRNPKFQLGASAFPIDGRAPTHLFAHRKKACEFYTLKIINGEGTPKSWIFHSDDFFPFQLSHEKNHPTFHYTGWIWMVNRDPYNGFLQSLYNWVV